jgi:hypothetical protein
MRNHGGLAHQCNATMRVIYIEYNNYNLESQAPDNDIVWHLLETYKKQRHCINRRLSGQCINTETMGAESATAPQLMTFEFSTGVLQVGCRYLI